MVIFEQKNINLFFSCKFFQLLVISTLDPDRFSAKNAGSGSGLSESGSRLSESGSRLSESGSKTLPLTQIFCEIAMRNTCALLGIDHKNIIFKQAILNI